MMKIKLFLFIFLFINSFISAQTKDSYQLSIHVLDIQKGIGGANIETLLFKKKGNGDDLDGNWVLIQKTKTDSQGNAKQMLAYNTNNKGVYKIILKTDPYFDAFNQKSFYPYVDVVFSISDEGHYHLPITLTSFGYSVYRGN